MVDVRLSYTKGVGQSITVLLDLALEADIFKSVSTRIELPDGTVNSLVKQSIMIQKHTITEEVMSAVGVSGRYKKNLSYG